MTRTGPRRPRNTGEFTVRRLSSPRSAKETEGEYAVELLIYDVIGDPWDGITARQVGEELKKHRNADKIFVRINSPGGYVHDGAAIYNLLVRHKAEIIVDIDGAAWSAASVVAMAGDTIRMAANATMMIHNPWSMTIGYAEDMRHEADVLDKMADTIAGTYGARAGGEIEHWLGEMAAETWYSAEEAVAAGLAHEVTDAQRQAALWDPKNMPFHQQPNQPNQSNQPAAGTVPPRDTHDGTDIEELTMPDKKKDESPRPDEAAVDAARTAGNAEGAKMERERIAAIDLALPGEALTEARQAAIAGGLTVEAAKAKALDVVLPLVSDLQKQAAELQGKLDACAQGGLAPLTLDASDDQKTAEAEAQAKADAAEPGQAFQAVVDAKVADGMKPFAASIAAAEEDPDGHAAWLESQQKKK